MQSVSKEKVRAVMRTKNSRKECERYLKLVQDMHENSDTVRCVVRVTDGLDVGVGLQQGSAQSPLCLQW